MDKETNLFDFIEERNFYDLADSERWQGFKMQKKDNTAEHSYYVTLFALFICKLLNLPAKETYLVLRYCLLHDFDETYSGDVRHPFKYNSFNGDAVREVIDNYSKHKIFGLPSNFLNNFIKEIFSFRKGDPIHKICKLGDWMSMYYHLEREQSCGNSKVLKDLNYCISEIIKLGKEFESIFGIENKVSEHIKIKINQNTQWQYQQENLKGSI